MEIKIGIIENEKMYADALTKQLHQWANETSSTLQINSFTTGEAVLRQNRLDYHILFLDIQLDGINGVETAKKLREKDYSGKLVFLTAYAEYVFDGYEVQALSYIMKPISYEKLKICMDTVKKAIQSEHYTVQNRDVVEKIPYNDILYIMSAKHYVEFTTTTNHHRHLIRLKDIINHLPPQFMQCHRTTIINIDYVRKLEGHAVIMQNKMRLSVSDTYLEAVRKKLESLVF